MGPVKTATWKWSLRCLQIRTRLSLAGTFGLRCFKSRLLRPLRIWESSPNPPPLPCLGRRIVIRGQFIFSSERLMILSLSIARAQRHRWEPFLFFGLKGLFLQPRHHSLNGSTSFLSQRNSFVIWGLIEKNHNLVYFRNCIQTVFGESSAMTWDSILWSINGAWAEDSEVVSTAVFMSLSRGIDQKWATGAWSHLVFYPHSNQVWRLRTFSIDLLVFKILLGLSKFQARPKILWCSKSAAGVWLNPSSHYHWVDDPPLTRPVFGQAFLGLVLSSFEALGELSQYGDSSDTFLWLANCWREDI